MSLHKFAEQVAANGRGDDSLLVHMTPDEVQNLQKFAQANGTTLTINPDTGLPEAGLLSDLFKAVAPIALGAFLGPGAFGIAGMGLSAGTAGLITGGITSLATGSLSRGLMAGLGAYGGAGLAQGALDAGNAQLASTMSEGAQAAAGAGDPTAGMNAVTREQALTAGAKAVSATPQAALNFAKGNLSNIGMAAAPLLAMQPTTKMPDPKDTGYIRQFDYNINPDTGKPDPLYGMRAMTPVKASEFGNKTFQGQRDLFRQQNPNPYELGVGSLNQPPQQQTNPMADGGIVALADGGPTYKQYSNEEIGKYLTANPNVDIAAATKQFNADPAAVNQYISGLTSSYTDPTATKGGSGTAGIYNQLTAQGIDPNELYAATTAIDPNYATQGWSKADIAEQYNLHKGAYALSDQLKGNVSDANWANFMDTNNYSVLDAARAFGLSTDEVQRRYDAANAQRNSVVPGAVQLPGATVYDNGAFGNYGSGNKTGVDYKGETVSIATPGDVITNPDNSRTVVPNVPGRPYGGFPGMEGVKSAYTAGGGSLGYTAPIPKDPQTAFNKMTDDSLDAYNYLMGKGKNLTQRKAETRDRPVMQRYDEAVLGRKTPKLVKTTETKTTGTTKVLNSDGTVNETETDKANFDYAAYLKANPDVQAELDKGVANFGTKDDLASAAYNHYITYGKAQKRPLKAAEGGMMGYAMGGGLGSLGSYSDGGRLLKGPGDGVSDSIPATIGNKQQPARLADGEFVIPARIVSELGNGSTDAGAKKLYAMMDRVQRARGKTTGKNKVAANSRSDKYLPA